MTFSSDGPGTGAEAWSEHPRMSTTPLLELDAAELDRVVVLAAHPDDESLGAGGLIAQAHRLGLEITVVVGTAGERSHPTSPTHSPAQLAQIRADELRSAVAVLAPEAGVHQPGWPDGRLTDHEEELVVRMVELIGDGRRTLLVAPWRHDGHPDHDAAGRAAAVTAARTGAALLEYPVWFWHWGSPDEAPWDSFQALLLDEGDSEQKARAQLAHRSQVEPLSDQPGDEVLLGERLLRHFAGHREVYVVQAPEDPALDDLHEGDDDPWGTASRWYELRKRALLLAALPRPEFRHALEVGSSSGALAADLAARCHDLLVVDAASHAAMAARTRLRGLSHVRVEQRVVPGDWPEAPAGGFDLVVLSEVGYFLSPRALDDVVEEVRASLSDDGVLVLCHWRHEIVGWPLDGPTVHEVVVAADVRPVVARYADDDVEILVLTHPGQLPDPQGAA